MTYHVVDGILVAEPIGALDGVVHVPPPVVRLHVAQSSVDSALIKKGLDLLLRSSWESKFTQQAY